MLLQAVGSVIKSQISVKDPRTQTLLKLESLKALEFIFEKLKQVQVFNTDHFKEALNRTAKARKCHALYANVSLGPCSE